MNERLPSVKTLSAAFGEEKGKKLRKALEGPVRDEEGRGRLERCDEILGTHGVECIPEGHNSKSPEILYCNTGDPYNTTLMFVGGSSYRVGNWGDIVERGNYD